MSGVGRQMRGGVMKSAYSFAIFFLRVLFDNAYARLKPGERRVGGSVRLHCSPVRTSLKPGPFGLVQRPTHQFSSILSAFVRTRGVHPERKMVGWPQYEIGRPSIPREKELSTTPEFRPTHPTLSADSGQAIRRKKSGIIDIFWTRWLVPTLQRGNEPKPTANSQRLTAKR